MDTIEVRFQALEQALGQATARAEAAERAATQAQAQAANGQVGVGGVAAAGRTAIVDTRLLDRS